MARRLIGHRIEELLDAIRIGLDLDVVFVGEFVEERRVFRYVSGKMPTLSIQSGGSDPLPDTYCYGIVSGSLPPVIRDASVEPLAQGLPGTASGVRAHLGVPLYRPDGTIFGSVCAVGSRVREDFDEQTLQYLRNIAVVIGNELQELEEEELELDERVARATRLFEPGSYAIHLQPIVDLRTSEIVHVEALTRFDSSSSRTTAEAFAEAWKVGLGVELELAAARSAISFLGVLPERIGLAVNVSPATISTPEFLDMCDACRDRIIVEITEHAVVEDYNKLLSAIEPLTDLGVRLAVDDVGSGYASLSHILELAPDILKLDMSLIRGIEQDVARHALVSALVTFARGVDAQLVAEGIETTSTRDVLRDLGVRWGQGWLTGRPEEAIEMAASLSANGSGLPVRPVSSPRYGK